MAKASKVSINPRRMAAGAVLVTIATVAMASPAYADALATAGEIIKEKTEQATEVAKKILITAAVLALLVGLAPMLWGQVKVKWIVSSLVACVMFGLAGTVVAAFKA